MSCGYAVAVEIGLQRRSEPHAIRPVIGGVLVYQLELGSRLPGFPRVDGHLRRLGAQPEVSLVGERQTHGDDEVVVVVVRERGQVDDGQAPVVEGAPEV